MLSELVDPDGETGNAAVEATFYQWDAGQIVIDFYEDNVGTDIDNPSNVGIHDFAHRYLWNPAAVDQLLAVEELERLNANVVDLSEEGTVAWPMTDRQGSIRDVANYDAASNTTTLTSHIVYDSFGNVVLHEDGSQSLLATFEIIFGHQGTLFSTETGLNYHRARWLDTSTGRWINEDPIGFAGNDYNVNRAMGNGLVNATDPDGLVGEPFIPQRGTWEGTPGDSWYKPPEKGSKPIYFRNGNPDFEISGAIHWGPDGQRARVRIDQDFSPINCKDKAEYEKEMDRRRDADKGKARESMRKRLKNPDWVEPKGYTWHHKSMDGTMELVKTSVHKAAVPHKGGFGRHIDRLKGLGRIRIGGKKIRCSGRGIGIFIGVGISVASGSDLYGAVEDNLDPFGAGMMGDAEWRPGPWAPTDEWFRQKAEYDNQVEALKSRNGWRFAEAVRSGASFSEAAARTRHAPEFRFDPDKE